MRLSPAAKSVLLLVLFLPAFCRSADTSGQLRVVRDRAAYAALVASAPDKQLVDLGAALSSAVFDIRYATANNFMNRQLYDTPRAFLRCAAARNLRNVEKELAQQGLALKIFDAYRPYSVTVAMWEPIRDERYVADPAKGSRHNRGCAVDLTLVDSRTGEELPMGTGYDDFSETAGHAYTNLPEPVLANRRLLRDTMVRHRFLPLASEWWHYDCAGWEQYELLDLSFREIADDAAASCLQ